MLMVVNLPASSFSPNHLETGTLSQVNNFLHISLIWKFENQLVYHAWSCEGIFWKRVSSIDGWGELARANRLLITLWPRSDQPVRRGRESGFEWKWLMIDRSLDFLSLHIPKCWQRWCWGKAELSKTHGEPKKTENILYFDLNLTSWWLLVIDWVFLESWHWFEPAREYGQKQ